MVTRTNTPNSVMGSKPTGRSNRAGSSSSDGQFPVQFAATSSTITPAASQMPSPAHERNQHHNQRIKDHQADEEHLDSGLRN